MRDICILRFGGYGWGWKILFYSPGDHKELLLDSIKKTLYNF